MTSLQNFMPSLMLFGFLVIVYGIYQSIGPKWKTQPSIPLIIGVGLLLVTAVLDVWIDSMVSAMDAAASKGTGHEPSQLVQAVILGGKNQIKLIELAIVPLAVALMASAFFARADLKHELEVTAYLAKRAELTRIDAEIAKIDSELQVALAANARGHEIVDRRAELLRLHRAASISLIDALDDFGQLINTKLVPPLK